MPNPAVDPVRFALWTLRDKAAQRRSPLAMATRQRPLHRLRSEAEPIIPPDLAHKAAQGR